MAGIWRANGERGQERGHWERGQEKGERGQGKGTLLIASGLDNMDKLPVQERGQERERGKGDIANWGKGTGKGTLLIEERRKGTLLIATVVWTIWEKGTLLIATVVWTIWISSLFIADKHLATNPSLVLRRLHLPRP